MIKIVVADDHPLICQALGQLLALKFGMDCVAFCHNLAAIEEELTARRPDVLLTDLQFDDGIAVRHIQRWTEKCNARVVVSSGLRSKLFAHLCFAEGAVAFVHKSCSPDVLARAIRDCVDQSSGQHHLIDASEKLDTWSEQENSTSRLLGNLSVRELDVFRDLGQGYSTQEIAARQFVSEKTVESHRSNIKRKLEIESLNELISLASVLTVG